MVQLRAWERGWMMLSDRPGQPKCKMTAREFRRLRRKTGGLFAEIELREAKLMREHPELYCQLAYQTIGELEQLALKSN